MSVYIIFPDKGNTKLHILCWVEPSNTMRAVLCTFMFCTYGIHRDVGHPLGVSPQPAIYASFLK